MLYALHGRRHLLQTLVAHITARLLILCDDRHGNCHHCNDNVLFTFGQNGVRVPKIIWFVSAVTYARDSALQVGLSFKYCCAFTDASLSVLIRWKLVSNGCNVTQVLTSKSQQSTCHRTSFLQSRAHSGPRPTQCHCNAIWLRRDTRCGWLALQIIIVSDANF